LFGRLAVAGVVQYAPVPQRVLVPPELLILVAQVVVELAKGVLLELVETMVELVELVVMLMPLAELGTLGVVRVVTVV
jgi:hypothetical protein